MATTKLDPTRADKLPELIERMADGSATIVLAPGEYLVEPLHVRGSLTLVGSGAAGQTSIVAKHGGDLLKIYGSNQSVVVRGLTLRAGRSDGGGAVEVTGDSRVLIESCVLADCEAAEFKGGAISVSDDARLELSRCLLSDNRGPRGGAVAVALEASARIDRCVFAGNEAEVGGAVCVSEYARVEVVSCSFFSNKASHPRGGGALFVTGTKTEGPNVTVANSLFVGALVVVNNPSRPGTLSLGHCIVPPGALEGLLYDDQGGNLDIQASLVEVEPRLWALATGAPGSGTADLGHIAPDAVDLLDRRLVHDGQADPGALARPGRAAGEDDFVALQEK